VLHLLRDPDNLLARDVITRQATDPTVRLSIVLLPGAAEDPTLTASLPGTVYRLGESPTTPGPTISPDDLLQLVFETDSVVTW
jgi:hypothetical protein